MSWMKYAQALNLRNGGDDRVLLSATVAQVRNARLSAEKKSILRLLVNWLFG